MTVSEQGEKWTIDTWTSNPAGLPFAVQKLIAPHTFKVFGRFMERHEAELLADYLNELEQLRPRAAKYREGLQVISLMSNWYGDDLETARINAQAFMLVGDALPSSQGEGA